MLKRKYARLREECQLAGIIPTVPEGAVRNERVDPALQQEQPLPELIAQAVRHGWAVPEECKPGLVDELQAIVDNPEMPAKVKVAAFNALRLADKDQYERDHPEEAGKARGGAKVAVVNNVRLGNVFDDIARDVAIIEQHAQQVDGAATGGIPMNGTAKPVDEA
jgi:hypothetical protein